MRVDNLIKWLEQFPDNYQVYIDTEGNYIEAGEENQEGNFQIDKILSINDQI